MTAYLKMPLPMFCRRSYFSYLVCCWNNMVIERSNKNISLITSHITVHIVRFHLSWILLKFQFYAKNLLACNLQNMNYTTPTKLMLNSIIWKIKQKFGTSRICSLFPFFFCRKYRKNPVMVWYGMVWFICLTAY